MTNSTRVDNICVEVMIMALNIKNKEVIKLAVEVAGMTGESMTEAIRKALQDRKQKIYYREVKRDNDTRLKDFLKLEIWPSIPRKYLGKPITKTEREKILGYDRVGA